ncbi:MAG: peptidylprolyl isomerase [Candidatus Saccharimonadales bacterium]
MKKLASKIKAKARRPSRRNTPPLDNRITNDTVAEHREQVLSRARKYIYPLQQSKHKLVIISITLFLLAIVAFFTYCTLALYKFKSSSTFLYRVTQVIPFPAARIGSDFVAYENYLFEVNHYTHYYRTQQNLDFNSDAGRQQLSEFQKRALGKVINDAYVKELAKTRGITVSDQEVEDQITIVRNQNRLGSNDKEFQSVLKDFWNWSENDFKRSLKTQLLAQKVVAALDTDTQTRADTALAQLKNGKDFTALAAEVSEDPVTKAAGGAFGFPIEKTDRDINPNTIEALFKLQPGQYSEVINIGYALEIIKNIETQPDGKIKAAHIVFNFKDINQYTNELKDQKKTRAYLRF